MINHHQKFGQSIKQWVNLLMNSLQIKFEFFKFRAFDSKVYSLKVWKFAFESLHLKVISLAQWLQSLDLKTRLSCFGLFTFEKNLITYMFN